MKLNTRAFCADVSKPVECQKLIEEVVTAFGRVGILVSNAGVDSFNKLDEITEQDLLRCSR